MEIGADQGELVMDLLTLLVCMTALPFMMIMPGFHEFFMPRRFNAICFVENLNLYTATGPLAHNGT